MTAFVFPGQGSQKVGMGAELAAASAAAREVFQEVDDALGQKLSATMFAGPEDQLLEAGQEEVFSRAEVESGRIEHHADTQTRPDQKEIEPSSPNAEKGNDHG